MRAPVYLCFVIVAAIPLWSQSTIRQTGEPTDARDNTQMVLPEPLNAMTYPVRLESDTRHNYLHAGVGFSTAYDNNILPGSGDHPISDTSFTITPSIAMDYGTPRLHQMFTYDSGYTFYQHTGSRNEQNQDLVANFQYRLSPHMTLMADDKFWKSSNVFGQSYLSSGETISGTSPASPVVVVPVADQLTNTVAAEYTYQYSRNSMVGASGMLTNLRYPNPNQVEGLYNSDSRGGTAFYSYRLSESRYVGVSYQYIQALGFPPTSAPGLNSNSQTQALLPFAALYLRSGFTLSVSAGPQYFNVVQRQPASEGNWNSSARSWTPAANAALSWQGHRANLIGGYFKSVTGGAGLLGAYYAQGENVSGQYQLAKVWAVGASQSYANTQNADHSMVITNPGGHILSAGGSVRRLIGDHFTAELGYIYLHESYQSIALINNIPNSSSVYLSVSYQLNKPIGR